MERTQSRRRLVVDPRLQYEMIAWALIAFTASAVIFSGILWFVLHDAQILAESVGMLPDHPFFARLDELRLSAAGALAVTFFGLVALVIYGGLLRSRRIVGPIMSLRRHLDGAAEGSLTPIQFREDDHFADLSARFNRLIEVLKTDR